MNRFWFNHCKTPAEKKEFTERLTYTQDMFLLMKVKLEKDLAVVVNSRRGLKSVLTQNYSEYQADRNATERTIKELIDLLPLF